jgi:hypothetical protein
VKFSLKIIWISSNPAYLIKRIRILKPNPLILCWVCVGFTGRVKKNKISSNVTSPVLVMSRRG